MRNLLLAGILLIAAFHVEAQIKGKIFVNGKEFKIGSDSIDSFTYKTLSSKLTRHGKKFLTRFSEFHLKQCSSSDSIKIIISPAETIKEYKIVDNHIAEARAWNVVNYLRRFFNVVNLKVTIHQATLLHSSLLQGTVVKIK
jgi:hypothetical protein